MSLDKLIHFYQHYPDAMFCIEENGEILWGNFENIVPKILNKKGQDQLWEAFLVWRLLNS